MRTVALVLVLTAAVAAHGEDSLTPSQQRLRAIYKELIEIDTTHSSGSTTKAAEAVAKRLRKAGVPSKDIEILGPQPRKKNLVARLHGSGQERPLVLLAHLDVVEAKRDDWSVDPFVLLERDGFYYGRGSLDDKAMAAIFVELFLRLQAEKTPLRRDVILALTADEEGGPDNGVQWLLAHQRRLVDAVLVLNEGGGGRMRAGKYLNNSVQASEKSYMNFRLEARNPGGHSSVPRRDNAIYELAHALVRLEEFEFPVELNEVTRAFFERSAKLESGQIAADMSGLVQDPPDPEAVRRLCAVPSYNAMLRTTCVATRLDGGHADNALPQTAGALVNCRILPGHGTEEVRAALAKAVGDEQVTITATEPETAGPSSPLDPQLMTTIERITTDMWPGLPVLPVMSTGASDSRYFRMAGIPAYGVSGIFVDMDDVRAHGRDERLGVKQLYEGQEFLGRLVHALSVSDATRK